MRKSNGIIKMSITVKLFPFTEDIIAHPVKKTSPRDYKNAPKKEFWLTSLFVILRNSSKFKFLPGKKGNNSSAILSNFSILV